MEAAQQTITRNSDTLAKTSEGLKLAETGLEKLEAVLQIATPIPVVGTLCQAIAQFLNVVKGFLVILDEILALTERMGETADYLLELKPIIEKVPREKCKRAETEMMNLTNIILDGKDVLGRFDGSRWYQKAWTAVFRSQLTNIVVKDQEMQQSLDRLQRTIQNIQLDATLQIAYSPCEFRPPAMVSPLVREINNRVVQCLVEENEGLSIEAAEIELTMESSLLVTAAERELASDPAVLQDVAIIGGMSKEEFTEQLGFFSSMLEDQLSKNKVGAYIQILPPSSFPVASLPWVSRSHASVYWVCFAG